MKLLLPLVIVLTFLGRIYAKPALADNAIKSVVEEEVTNALRDIDVTKALRDVLNDVEEDADDGKGSTKTTSKGSADVGLLMVMMMHMETRLRTVESSLTDLEQKKEERVPWVSQATNVCYEAKGNNQGIFKLNKEGLLIGLKLVHKSGHLSCHERLPSFNSRWGCKSIVLTLISNAHKVNLFPNQEKAQLAVDGKSGDNLVFVNTVDPIYAEPGTELHIWYTEDIKDHTEQDNGGRHCVDVYAKFKQLE